MTVDANSASLLRPIIGIENRTAQEVFDIMCDRFRLAALPAPDDGLVERLNSVTEEDAYARPWTFGQTCREAATVIQTLQRENARLEGEAEAWAAQLHHAEYDRDFNEKARANWKSRAEAAEQQVRDIRDENARMREALTRIAEMDGTAGTEKGPPCEWTENGVTTTRPTGIGNFANHIARLALKNQESDRG